MNSNPPIECQSRRPWKTLRPPRRILLIRFHAVGDVALTLPASAGLRALFPSTVLDYFTTGPNAELLQSVPIFNRVHTLRSAPNKPARILAAAEAAHRISSARYDCIIDLQRNWVSRFIRRTSGAQAWSEFDRFGPRSAHDRTLDTFHRAGFSDVQPNFKLPVRADCRERAERMLRNAGVRSGDRLIVLNPSGLWPSRQWPDEYYHLLARDLSVDPGVAFLFLGTERIAARIGSLVADQSLRTVNLIGRTTLGDALAILQQAHLVISEDSGLLHLAWAAGRPILAIFGSSNHIWSSPPGPSVTCLHSGDLACGACMAATCRFGDVHCLRRHDPSSVAALTRTLLHRSVA